MNDQKNSCIEIVHNALLSDAESQVELSNEGHVRLYVICYKTKGWFVTFTDYFDYAHVENQKIQMRLRQCSSRNDPSQGNQRQKLYLREKKNLIRCKVKRYLRDFATRSDSNRPALLQKLARVLKLWSAPLLFAYGIEQVFSWCGSNEAVNIILGSQLNLENYVSHQRMSFYMSLCTRKMYRKKKTHFWPFIFDVYIRNLAENLMLPMDIVIIVSTTRWFLSRTLYIFCVSLMSKKPQRINGL